MFARPRIFQPCFTTKPSGTGLGNPGYIFNNEISADLKYDKAGVVGMANETNRLANGYRVPVDERFKS